MNAADWKWVETIDWKWVVTTVITAGALLLSLLNYLRGRRRLPRLSLNLRDGGEVQMPGGPTYRLIDLVLENEKGAGTPTEFFFQIQLPFLPPSLSKPLGKGRPIEPLFGVGGGDHWKDWIIVGDGTIGISFTNNDAIKAEPGLQWTLAQIRVPTSWFGPQPRPRVYKCHYSLTSSPGETKEGILRVNLFELAKGYY